MHVVGLDVSTRTVDLVKLADDNTAEWISVPCADRRGPLFAARLAAELAPKASWWDDVYLIGVEQLWSHSRATLRALAFVTGAVTGTVPRTVTALLTSPQEWRTVCGMPAKCSKQEAARWATETWCDPPAMLTQDSLDAFCIGFAARALNDKAITESAA